MALGQGTRVDVHRILLTEVGEAVLNEETLVSQVLKILTELKKDDRRYRSAYYVRNALDLLVKKGLLCFEKKDKTVLARLTKKGNRELEKHATVSETLRSKEWDGKWRLVIFDIEESNKGKRDRIRRNLIRCGFEKLQNSVWVYPYDCEDLIAFLKADCAIDKGLLYTVSEKIQDDAWLRKKFGLPA